MSEQPPTKPSPGWYPQPDGSSWYWDGTQYTDHISPEEVTDRAGRRRRQNLIAFGAAGLVVLAVAVAAVVTHKSGEDKASDACHDYMEARLKAPATADFSDEWAAEVSSGGYKAYGTVDSENGFGAKVRLTYSCDVTDGYVVSDLRTSED